MNAKKNSQRAGEFDLIERYFAPLAGGAAGTFGLHNDAAVLPLAPGERLVTTVDTMIEGRHFLDCPADLVARKLLRVNLSDLAAMGATPFGYLLASAWPLDIEESWIAAFSAGLAQDQAEFGVTLFGGDTTGTPGPMTLSLTAFGKIAGERALDRASLKAGEDIYVTGSLGEAWLGLQVLRGKLAELTETQRDELVGRYRLPQPRVAVGQALLAEGLARSAIDVSDGLAADLGHMLSASGLAAEVELAALPLGATAEAALSALGAPRQAVLSGGDDYELLFAADPQDAAALSALAAGLGVAMTRIGRVGEGSGLTLRGADGAEVLLDSRGWSHF